MTTRNYNRADSIDFGKKVSRKIKGWYSNDTFHEKAVDRIVLQREEIYTILEKVEKVSVKKLLRYLDSSGFFYRPSSPNRHHNFPGGLAEHSLGVFRIVEEWNDMTPNERKNSELY
jgi:23S rRNA maturation-related 3'-5' exoribonuclease YhaM